MLKRILIATDLSEASSRVIGQMNFFYCLGVTEAVLVYCVNVRDVGNLTDTLRESLRRPLEEQKKMLELKGFRVTSEIVLGLPHLEINRLAEEKDCSVIVVGSHGRTMMGKVLLGSVASAVIQNALRPVLVVRLKIIEGECITCAVACENLSYHVLYPSDFSDTAERAFAFVEKIVESGCKRVSLMHVQEEARIGKHPEGRLEEFDRVDRARLERLEDILKAKGATEVSIVIPYGSPISEILKYSRENDVSIIVMGSQGRGFISEIFQGSVANNVTRHAPVPVLLVPASRQ